MIPTDLLDGYVLRGGSSQDATRAWQHRGESGSVDEGEGVRPTDFTVGFYCLDSAGLKQGSGSGVWGDSGCLKDCTEAEENV